jgi:hypothetical protein
MPPRIWRGACATEVPGTLARSAVERIHVPQTCRQPWSATPPDSLGGGAPPTVAANEVAEALQVHQRFMTDSSQVF